MSTDPAAQPAEVVSVNGLDISCLTSSTIIDNTGHFLHLEDPDNVNARIVGFLT